MRRALLLLVLIAFIGTVLFAYITPRREVAVLSNSATNTEFPIYKGGIVSSSHVVNVFGPEGAIVKEVKIREGDLVQPDQTIIVLDDTSISNQLTQARNQLRYWEEQLNFLHSVRREIDSSSTCQVVMPSTPSTATVLCNVLCAAYRDAAQVDHEIKLTRILIDNQKITVSELERKLKLYTVKAPIRGVVTALNVEVGQPIALDKPLATIVDPENKTVSVKIHAINAAKFDRGYVAKVYFGGASYTATVTNIQPVAEDGFVGVELDLGSAPIPLGASVMVDFNK